MLMATVKKTTTTHKKESQQENTTQLSCVYLYVQLVTLKKLKKVSNEHFLFPFKTRKEAICFIKRECYSKVTLTQGGGGWDGGFTPLFCPLELFHPEAIAKTVSGNNTPELFLKVFLQEGAPLFLFTTSMTAKVETLTASM